MTSIPDITTDRCESVIFMKALPDISHYITRLLRHFQLWGLGYDVTARNYVWFIGKVFDGFIFTAKLNYQRLWIQHLKNTNNFSNTNLRYHFVFHFLKYVGYVYGNDASLVTWKVEK
jgi:hypothetical protein